MMTTTTINDNDDDDDDDDDNDDDDDDDNDDDDNSPQYLPHTAKKKAKIVHQKLNLNEARAASSAIANRRHTSLRGQTDTLSSLILQGGGDLNDFPCSTSTMQRFILRLRL